jgi:ppGpp synthetase/RelA/SpoT-type nucleotidyltranferase
MSDIDHALEEYDQNRGLHKDFCTCLKRLLRALLRAAHIREHSVTGRVKRRDSYAKKLEDKLTEGAEVGDITDVVGVRVTTYFEDDVDKVAAVVEQEFEIDRENSEDKRATMHPKQFGYQSVHYVAVFKDARIALAEYKRFSGCKVEIQIRSILQHAWAEIEHDLGYKSPIAIPKSVERRFAQLASLLESADKEFVQIRDDLEEYRKEVSESVSLRPQDVRIDKDSLAEYIDSSKSVQELDSRVANMRRTQVRKARSRSLDIWVEELDFCDIKTVADIEEELKQHAEEVLLLAEYLWQGKTYRARGGVAHGASVSYLSGVLAGKSGGEERLREFTAKFIRSGSRRARQEHTKRMIDWYRAWKKRNEDIIPP